MKTDTPGSDAGKTAPDLLRRFTAAAGDRLPPELIDHAAFGILAASGAGKEAVFDALARLRRFFVDWNELRHAVVADIVLALAGFPDSETTARELRAAYRRQFDESGRSELYFPEDARPPDVRKRLARLFPALSKHAVALLVYQHLPGQPLPLSDAALAVARQHGLVGRQGSRAQVRKRLEEELAPAEIVRCVQLLEMEASGHPYGEAWPKPPAPAEPGRAPRKKKAKKKK